MHSITRSWEFAKNGTPHFLKGQAICNGVGVAAVVIHGQDTVRTPGAENALVIEEEIRFAVCN